jgi:hypothetical protein
MELKGQLPEDVSIDTNGFLYVYAEDKLYQYDSMGNLLSEMPIDQTRWDSRGSMQIVDHNVYIRGGMSEGYEADALIARIENGQLVSPSDQELQEPLHDQDGFIGRSGKRYVAVPQDTAGAALEVIEKDGTKSPRFLPVQNIRSIVFLGEDRQGNAYIQTEAEQDGGISVAVTRFDATGNYLDTIPIPDNSYEFHTIKRMTVGEDGTVYQMIPAKDKLVLKAFLAN